MITSRAWAGNRYAVLGLARSGAAAVRALLASGAEVVAWDEDAERRGNGAALTHALTPLAVGKSPSPVEGEGGLRFADPLGLDLSGFAGVVVSPGVPLNRHPIAGHAARFGVPVIGDIELFAQARGELPPHKVVGITGTNGKSTTTALVHHILKTAGVPTTMGGNIGLPILGQAPLTPNDNGVGVYVLELSSFQIDLTFSLDCDVAVLLNITPDHLDRYESFEAYAAAKLRLFEMQSDAHSAVVDWQLAFDGRVPDPLSPGARRYQAVPELERNIERDWPALQGAHNRRNAVAAWRVVQALERQGVPVDDDALFSGCRTFPGLPHRTERVREREGVLFVNDSKATNPDSAAPALAAYERVHWIVGGQAKTDGLGPCAAQLGHVRGAYAIGEAGPLFVRLLTGRVPHVEDSQTLAAAVTAAAGRAEAGDTVLLSPACASFDQFRDFEARGDEFRRLVEAL